VYVYVMFDINNVWKRLYVYTRKQSFQSIPESGSARRPFRLLCISSAIVHKYSYICTAHIGIHLRHIIIIGVRFAKTVFFSNAITGFKAPYIHTIHPTSGWYYACVPSCFIYYAIYTYAWSRRNERGVEGRE